MRSPLLPLALLCLTLAFACENEPVSADKALVPPATGAGAAGASAGASGSSSAGTAGTAGTEGAQPGGNAGWGGYPQEPYDPENPTCPKLLPGPPMVLLRGPTGVPYCMDQHEIRQRDYALLVEAEKADPKAVKALGCLARPNAKVLSPEQSTTPGTDYVTGCGAPGTWNPKEHGDWPKTCVGECAARAYCELAGKELCGAIGGGSLDVDKDGYVDVSAEHNTWMNACTNGGTTKLPYGDERQESVCEAPTLAGQQPPDKEPASCQSKLPGFSQVHELGNGLREYIDGCMGPEQTNCAVIGPNLASQSPGQPGLGECGQAGIQSGPSPMTTFRCCKTLPK